MSPWIMAARDRDGAATALDPLALRRAFGAFPTGVVAVAAHVAGRPIGLAASSFTSVSLDPPLVSVVVSNASGTWPELRRSPGIGLSVLASHHVARCRQLAGPVDGRFADLRVQRCDDGAVILDESAAAFDCALAQEIPAGDHTIALLRVVAAYPGEHTSPLVFHRSAFGTLHGHGVPPT